MRYVVGLVVDDEGVEAVVAYEDVGAVADHKIGEALLAGEEDGAYQFVYISGGDEEGGGAANAKGVVLAHRLVASDGEAGGLFQEGGVVGGEGYGWGRGGARGRWRRGWGLGRTFRDM